MDYLSVTEGPILLTTGSKELAKFTALPEFSQRVYARVLPMPDSLRLCQEAGLQPSHILAMQGPFSKEMNIAMLNALGAKYLVTKSSGKAGGFEEKLDAARATGAVAVIIGEQHESECDPYTDYFGSRIVRTVILGFSTHTRDLFPEMRKAAARFEGTAHLAERNAEYEHREKYSMGHGYYLGTHRYSGWQVSKESCRDKEGVIKRFAVVAGNPENVCIENPAPVQTAAPETVADARVEIVEYSEKSIAVFGDTKPLRDTLRDLNGLFRAYLTHDGTRCAGWIFSKRREQEVRSALAAYTTITFNPGRASARPTTPESMNEQITAIAALLLEINGKEKYTAFFDFSGHVRTFSIRIYSGKWSQGKAPLFNLSLQNKDGQQWRNWDNAHAMSGDSILSFLTTLL